MNLKIIADGSGKIFGKISGIDSIEAGKKALLIGFVLVIVFMILSISKSLVPLLVFLQKKNNF